MSQQHTSETLKQGCSTNVCKYGPLVFGPAFFSSQAKPKRTNHVFTSHKLRLEEVVNKWYVQHQGTSLVKSLPACIPLLSIIKDQSTLRTVM